MSKQEELWNRHYDEILNFIRDNKRRPSKHNIEDHGMLNWIKYNKKIIAKGEMPLHRLEKFNRLMALADKYRRYNACTYANPIDEAKPLDLFKDISV